MPYMLLWCVAMVATYWIGTCQYLAVPGEAFFFWASGTAQDPVDEVHAGHRTRSVW